MNFNNSYCLCIQELFCFCCPGDLHWEVPCSCDDQQWAVGGCVCARWPQQRRSGSPSGLLPRAALQRVHVCHGRHEELCGSKWQTTDSSQPDAWTRLDRGHRNLTHLRVWGTKNVTELFKKKKIHTRDFTDPFCDISNVIVAHCICIPLIFLHILLDSLNDSTRRTTLRRSVVI